MQIQPHATNLIGKWIVEDGQIRADAICEQIQWLTSHHLKKITVSEKSGGWETLFQDPDDGRYWERFYPQSEMHGGGPPALKLLSSEEAKSKYGNKVL